MKTLQKILDTDEIYYWIIGLLLLIFILVGLAIIVARG